MPKTDTTLTKTDTTLTIHVRVDASKAKRELASLERIVKRIRAATAEVVNRKPNPR